MKIFDWVQRKLSLSSSQYCRVSDESTQDVVMGAKKNGVKNDTLLVAFDSEKDALLLHYQTLGSMLSVGTLGHANLFCTVHQQEEAEEPPAKEIVREYSGIDQLFVQPTNDHPSSSDAIEAKKETPVAVAKEESAEPLLKESKERREERTTLADLFAVDDSPTDTDREPCKKSEKVLREQKKWKNMTKKGKESSTTAKSIGATNKLLLITRMLKKKIHPDHVVLAKGVSDVEWDGAAHEAMTKLEANMKTKWLKDVQVSTMEMS